VVVQRLAEYPAEAARAGAGGGGDSRDNPAAKSEAASESRSCLAVGKRWSTEGATAAEAEVVGTCVYYYLPEAGHDARSRIGTKTCVQFGGSFSDWGARASCSVGQERQECGHCLECGGVRGL
jgi:hypothetical protein